MNNFIDLIILSKKYKFKEFQKYNYYKFMNKENDLLTETKFNKSEIKILNNMYLFFNDDLLFIIKNIKLDYSLLNK